MLTSVQESKSLFQQSGAGFLKRADGARLYIKSWLPDGNPVSTVVLVHGLAEHIGRYEHVARYLTKRGHAVFGFDLRGHGQSDGKRIFINRFSDYVDDLGLLVDQVTSAYPTIPRFILAHSLGTTIALKYILNSPEAVNGLALTGTAIVAGEDIAPILITISGMLATLFRRLPTIAINSSTVSRDPSVVKTYQEDPLVTRGKIPARTGAEINRAFRDIQENMKKISLPLLIMHGSEDQLTNPQGSRLLHAGISSKDTTLIIWEGLYHELLNEPEQKDVLTTISDWMAGRMVTNTLS